MNRKLIITGVALATGQTRSQVMRQIRLGKLPAWMYEEKGLVPYSKSTHGRQALIYVYEHDVNVVHPLPEPVFEQPTGELIVKEGAAAILGRTTDWIRDLATQSMIPAWVYDDAGVNLVPLRENKSTDRNARVLHLLKSDVLAYKERIEKGLTSPSRAKRTRKMPKLSPTQEAEAIEKAQGQLEKYGFVVTDRIRREMGLNTMYAHALRELRERYNWPLRFPTQSEATKKRLA